MRKHMGKNVVCVCVLYGLENVYDSVNRKALWQVLRVYYVGGKLCNGIKSMYVNSLAYVRVTG